MAAGRSLIPDLDRAFPWRGPCGICGGPDARHRLWDAIAESVRAGDSPGFVAEAYDLTLEQVWTVLTRWHGLGLRKRVHSTRGED